MKSKIMILGALLTLLSLSACHDDSDVVLSYGNTEILPFSEAEKSFAGKYRVFWKAMNTNYALWDYEKSLGLDWDEHYKTFLPKFEELDAKDYVGDSELTELMKEMVAPLHDGHLYVSFINHYTNNECGLAPSWQRIKQRKDSEESEGFEPTLDAYKSQIVEQKIANTNVAEQLKDVLFSEGVGLSWVKNRYNQLLKLPSPTEVDAMEIKELSTFINECEYLLQTLENVKTMAGVIIEKYNQMVVKYAHLKIPYLDPIDSGFAAKDIRVQYAQFNDGIVYLSIDKFQLSSYLNAAVAQETFDMTDVHTKTIVERVSLAWNAWFNAIQRLHKNKQLKGVIFDVRNNGGGVTNDSKYLLGALLPAGGFYYGYARFKRGVGRYDYSPLMPQSLQTLETPHEIINDVPIVVLANAQSVSMSEMTAFGAQQLDNGCVVGRRSHGGLCTISSNQRYYSDEYSGIIGSRGVTPVYCYIPHMAFLNTQKQPMEGVGVTPNIEAPLDIALFELEKVDTQLNRALEYIRTGK